MIVGLFAASSAACAGEAYHPPATAAEKTLDAVFQVNLSSPEFFNALYGRVAAQENGRVPDNFITPDLWASIRKAEADKVQAECGGAYVEGDLCGLEYDALLCGQDHPDVFLYRTLVSSQDHAVITYSFNGEAHPGETAAEMREYKLVRQNGAWLLDGISCGQNRAKFNISPP